MNRTTLGSFGRFSLFEKQTKKKNLCKVSLHLLSFYFCKTEISWWMVGFLVPLPPSLHICNTVTVFFCFFFDKKITKPQTEVFCHCLLLFCTFVYRSFAAARSDFSNMICNLFSPPRVWETKSFFYFYRGSACGLAWFSGTRDDSMPANRNKPSGTKKRRFKKTNWSISGFLPNMLDTFKPASSF